jgi:hypothetical protein
LRRPPPLRARSIALGRRRAADLWQMATKDLKLYKAARDGDFETALNMLVDGANVRYRDIWDQMTPLMVAAYRGHARCVVLLLGKGASSMSRAKDGSTPLHYAAGFGHTEVCKVLCEHALPNAKNSRGETPIDWAVSNGRAYIVELLTQDRSNGAKKDEIPHARLVIALKQHIRVLRWRIKAAKEVAEMQAEEEAADEIDEFDALYARTSLKRGSQRASRESQESVDKRTSQRVSRESLPERTSRRVSRDSLPGRTSRRISRDSREQASRRVSQDSVQ